MRCKKCGSLMSFLTQDNKGFKYYGCGTNNLGFFDRHQKGSQFIRCNTVQDQNHNVIRPGTVIYWTNPDGRAESFTVGQN